MVVFPTSELNVPLVYDFFVVVQGHCNAFHPFYFCLQTNEMYLLPNCTLEQQQSSSNDGGKRSIGRLTAPGAISIVMAERVLGTTDGGNYSVNNWVIIGCGRFSTINILLRGGNAVHRVFR